MVLAQATAAAAGTGLGEFFGKVLDALDPIIAPAMRFLRSASVWVANRFRRKDKVRSKPQIVFIQELAEFDRRQNGEPMRNYLIVPGYEAQDPKAHPKNLGKAPRGKAVADPQDHDTQGVA